MNRREFLGTPTGLGGSDMMGGCRTAPFGQETGNLSIFMNPYELFNIAEDIGETHNCYGEQRGLAEGLARRPRHFLVDCKATIPIDKSTGKAVRLP